MALIWMGRYVQVEKDQIALIDDLNKLNQFDYWQQERRALALRAVCYAAGMQDKKDLARKYFLDLVQMVESGEVKREDFLKIWHLHFGEML